MLRYGRRFGDGRVTEGLDSGWAMVVVALVAALALAVLVVVVVLVVLRATLRLAHRAVKLAVAKMASRRVHSL